MRGGIGTEDLEHTAAARAGLNDKTACYWHPGDAGTPSLRQASWAPAPRSGGWLQAARHRSVECFEGLTKRWRSLQCLQLVLAPFLALPRSVTTLMGIAVDPQKMAVVRDWRCAA